MVPGSLLSGGDTMGCPPTAVAAALWALLGRLSAAAPTALPGHSIANPPDINLLAKMWQLTGKRLAPHFHPLFLPRKTPRKHELLGRSRSHERGHIKHLELAMVISGEL